jgi:hypothetical protein
MATLTNEDFTTIKRLIQNNATLRATFKAWGLSKADYKAMFQAIENWVTDGFSVTPANSLSTAITNAVTGSPDQTQRKHATDAWTLWKAGTV